MFGASWFLAVIACMVDESPPPEGGPSFRDQARVEPGTVAAPACALASQCPGLGVDPARCVDDPSWFELATLDGEVVEVRLTGSAGVGSLEPGRWYTVVGTTCDEALTFSFEVGREGEVAR
jgi:hypothetical protein